MCKALREIEKAGLKNFPVNSGSFISYEGKSEPIVCIEKIYSDPTPTDDRLMCADIVCGGEEQWEFTWFFGKAFDCSRGWNDITGEMPVILNKKGLVESIEKALFDLGIANKLYVSGKSVLEVCDEVAKGLGVSSSFKSFSDDFFRDFADDWEEGSIGSNELEVSFLKAISSKFPEIYDKLKINVLGKSSEVTKEGALRDTVNKVGEDGLAKKTVRQKQDMKPGLRTKRGTQIK